MDKSLDVSTSESLTFTNFFVTLTSPPLSISAAWKLISSIMRSNTVCSLLAPIFSTVLLRWAAHFAISRSASSSKVSAMPSVFINAICWTTSCN